MPLGFEVYREIKRPDPALLEQFRDIATADLGDVMFKRGALDTRIQPIYRPMRKIVGPAVTVSAPDAAFDVVKVGLEMTQPGDVVVINSRGDVDHALLGGNVCRGLRSRGVAALIADGAVRDANEIQAEDFPVFARGIALIMGPRYGAGEINVPIACGGVVVNPGDIIVADEDGIVVVPQYAAEAVIEAAHRLHERHMSVQPTLLRGEITDIANILNRVQQAGAEIHDGSFDAVAAERGARAGA